ncbi:hypothetical protein GCM10028808_73510 [Spirosoma migulaei]
MKYDIHVNQKSIIDYGYDIDIVDGAIIDFCRFFASSRACRFFVEGDKRYYWISHKIICEQLPILKLKPDSAYRRMKALCDKSFMEAHPENRRMNASWYAFGVLADSLFSTIGERTVPTENNPMVPLSTSGNKSEPSDENPVAIGRESVAPTDENPMYKGIPDKGINDKETKKGAVAFAPVSEAIAAVIVKTEKKEKAPKVAPNPPTVVTMLRTIVESKVDGYYWDAKNGAAAKSIADKLRAAIKQKSGECSDEDIANAFTVLIDESNKLTTFYQFTDLPKLNGNFNEIITQIRNGKSASSQSNRNRSRQDQTDDRAELDRLASEMFRS